MSEGLLAQHSLKNISVIGTFWGTSANQISCKTVLSGGVVFNTVCLVCLSE